MASRPKTRLVHFRVALVRPEGADLDDVATYILEAVQSHRGSLRPPGSYAPEDEGDPMFDLDAETVSVTRIR